MAPGRIASGGLEALTARGPGALPQRPSNTGADTWPPMGFVPQRGAKKRALKPAALLTASTRSATASTSPDTEICAAHQLDGAKMAGLTATWICVRRGAPPISFPRRRDLSHPPVCVESPWLSQSCSSCHLKCLPTRRPGPCDSDSAGRHLPGSAGPHRYFLVMSVLAVRWHPPIPPSCPGPNPAAERAGPDERRPVPNRHLGQGLRRRLFALAPALRQPRGLAPARATAQV